MTLDEKIKHIGEIVKKNRGDYENCPRHREDIEHQTCEECAEEHEQLAEWLEELKFLRQWKAYVVERLCEYDCSSVGEVAHKAYNKAIKEVLNELSDMEFQGGTKETLACAIATKNYIQNNVEILLKQ